MNSQDTKFRYTTKDESSAQMRAYSVSRICMHMNKSEWKTKSSVIAPNNRKWFNMIAINTSRCWTCTCIFSTSVLHEYLPFVQVSFYQITSHTNMALEHQVYVQGFLLLIFAGVYDSNPYNRHISCHIILYHNIQSVTFIAKKSHARNISLYTVVSHIINCFLLLY